MKSPLTEQDYQDAAIRLNVEIAAIKAVSEVESRNDGFLDDDSPVILFERHKFSKYTGRKYDISNPDISAKKAGGYGKISEQHERLKKAVALDRDAALRATSWGRFQILGANWESLDYESLQEFINAMYESEAKHLDAFLRYVEVNHLVKYLKTKNWVKFAKGYNGINYAINNYDVNLANSYAKYVNV